jgi:hypothetical protein
MTAGSDPVRLGRERASGVAGVHGTSRLEEEHVDLLLGHRPGLDAARDDEADGLP